MKAGMPWTEEDDKTLKNNYTTMTNRELTRILKRGYHAITRRLQTLSLRRTKYADNFENGCYTPEYIKIKREEYERRYPKKYIAHTKVSQAIREGKLKSESCLLCGSIEKIEAHHVDYNKPLDVAWLCGKCHRRYHVKLNDLGIRT